MHQFNRSQSWKAWCRNRGLNWTRYRIVRCYWQEAVYERRQNSQMTDPKAFLAVGRDGYSKCR